MKLGTAPRAAGAPMTEGTRATVRDRSVDHPLETANPGTPTVRSKQKSAAYSTPFALTGCQPMVG